MHRFLARSRLLPALLLPALPYQGVVAEAPAQVAVRLPAPPERALDGGWVTGNLVGNPSVEEPAKGGGPAGWTFSGDGSGAWDRTTARTGDRSLRIDGEGRWISDPFPLREGEVTLIEGASRLRGSGRWGALIRLDFLDSRGARLGKLDPYLADEHPWRLQDWGGLSPPGTAAGRLVAYTYRDPGLTAWFDDLAVRQWASPPPPPRPFPPAAALALDLGPEASPVMAGWSRLAPSDLYDPVRGYGWVPGGRLQGRDQTGGAYRPQRFDESGEPVDRDRTLLDPLTRDGIAGVGAAGLTLDLPDGRYRAFAVAGHATDGEAPPYFDLRLSSGGGPGLRLRKRYPGPAFAWGGLPLEARDGRLHLGLAADAFGGAWTLTALLVYPEQDPAGRALEEAVVDSLRTLPSDLKATAHRLPAEPEEVFRHAPTLRLPATEPAPRLAGLAAPGMSVDLPLRLVPASDARDLRLEMTPTGDPGAGPAPAPRLWWVRDRALPYNRGFVAHGLYRIVPDELSPQLPGWLAAAQEHRFWIRVAVPAGAPAGTWRWRLRATDAAGAVAEAEVEVRVLPLRLEDPGAFQHVYFYGSQGALRAPATVGVEEEAKALTVAAVRDLADHVGPPAATLTRWPVYRRVDGTLAVELQFARQHLQRFLDAGYPARDAAVLLQPMLRQLARELAPREVPKFGKHLTGSPKLPEEYWTALGDLVSVIDAMLREEGVVRRFYNPWDEPFGEDLPLFARVAAVVRQRAPAARVLCNVPPRVYYRGGDAGPGQALAPHCDAWWVYGTLTDAQREAERARGILLMGGFVPRGFTEARAAAGALRWRRGEAGGSWWAYDAWTGTPQTQLDGPSYGDRCMVYPTDPPSPRLIWEATRMGYEDLRYLVTLERWVEAAANRASGGARRATRQARDLLKRLRREIDPVLPVPSGGNGRLQEIRHEVQASLERMRTTGAAPAAP